MPPRFLITNSVILNGGDAAIVLSMAASLRREFGAGAEIKVLCHSAPAARRLYGGELEIEPALEEAHRLPGRPGWAGKLLGETFAPRMSLGLLTAEERKVDALFGWADAVISCGGGFLTDRYSPTKRLAGLRRALRSGRPLVFYAQSVGPFERARSRRAFREVLSGAAAVTVRDAASLEEVRALGLDAELTADEALLFDAPPPESPPDLREGLEAGRPLVAVSVRSWHFPGAPAGRDAPRDRYRGAVARAVERLVAEKNARVVFLSTCQGVPEYTHDDSNVAAQVFGLLAPEVRGEVAVDRGYHHPARLRALLGQCQAAICTRMHAAVLAMLAGTPALAVGYEAKSAGLYSRLGLAEWCLDISGPEIEELPERAVRLLEAREKLAAELPSRIAPLAGAARGNARAVRRVLEESGSL